MNQFGAAEDDFTLVLELDPNDDPSYYHRGKVKMILEKYSSALADLNHAIDLDDKNGSYFKLRGNLKYQLEDKTGGCGDWKVAEKLGEPRMDFYIKKYCE